MASRFPAPPPYDENVIVNLIEEIYKLLILMCYLTAGEVVFAPAGIGHAIDEALCHELNLAQRVISLMKRLPYQLTSPHGTKGIFPPEAEAKPLRYVKASHIRMSRSPYNLGIPNDAPEHDGQLLLPCELPIFVGGSECLSWILDTEENVIRRADPTTNYADPDALLRGDDQPPPPDDYRHAPADSAPDLLREYVEGLRKLRWMGIPGDQQITDLEEFRMKPKQLKEYLRRPRRIRNILVENYGWGTDDFRAEDWENEHEQILEDPALNAPSPEEVAEGAAAQAAQLAAATEALTREQPLTIEQIRARNHRLDQDRIERGYLPLKPLHKWIDEVNYTLMRTEGRNTVIKGLLRETANWMNEQRAADGLPPLSHLLPWIEAHDADWLLGNVEWWDLRPAEYYPPDFQERRMEGGSQAQQGRGGASHNEL